MMNKIIGGISVLALVLSIMALVGGNQSVPKGFGGTTNYDALALTAGISNVGTGGISNTDTGTSTLSMYSTSTTKGWCTNFHATSSATTLNMTFMASSTASVTNVFPSGIVPVVKYGACS